MNTQLSITTILSTAFKVFTKNWVKIILAQLFVLVVTLLPLIFLGIAFFFGFGMHLWMYKGPAFSPIFFITLGILILIYIVYSIYIQAGLIRFYLDMYNGVESKITSILKTNRKLFSTYLLFSVTLFFIILGGFILLIIPAIIFGIMFCLSRFYVIEKGMKTNEALKISKEKTKGYRLEIFLFGLTMVLFYIVLSVAKNLGSLLSYFILQPVFLIAFIYIYKVLSSHSAPQHSDTVKTEVDNTTTETEIVVQPQELVSGHDEDKK